MLPLGTLCIWSLCLEDPSPTRPSLSPWLPSEIPSNARLSERTLLATPHRMAQMLKNLPTMEEIKPRFEPWVGKIPWKRKWQSTPVFLPGKSHGRRKLAGHNPWGGRTPHSWAGHSWAHVNTPHRTAASPDQHYGALPSSFVFLVFIRPMILLCLFVYC